MSAGSDFMMKTMKLKSAPALGRDAGSTLARVDSRFVRTVSKSCLSLPFLNATATESTIFVRRIGMALRKLCRVAGTEQPRRCESSKLLICKTASELKRSKVSRLRSSSPSDASAVAGDGKSGTKSSGRDVLRSGC